MSMLLLKKAVERWARIDICARAGLPKVDLRKKSEQLAVITFQGVNWIGSEGRPRVPVGGARVPASGVGGFFIYITPLLFRLTPVGGLAAEVICRRVLGITVSAICPFGWEFRHVCFFIFLKWTRMGDNRLTMMRWCLVYPSDER